MRSQGVELRVRHLSEQLRTKDAEVAALRSQIGLLTSDFKYNLKLLKERDWELDQNEHQMKEMLKKIADKEKEHKQALAEIARYKESAERDRGSIVELKETLGQYQDAVHTVRRRLEEARQMRDQELSHHQSERELLQGKLHRQGEELRAEMEVARKEAAAACERKWSKLLHECNQSVAALVSEKGTLLLQKRQLEKDIEGMKEQVRQLQQTVADLSSVTGESRKECATLRDQLETLKVEIHCKVEELENERRRAAELEHEKDFSATRIAALEHERSHIEDSIRQRLTGEHESAVRDLYSQLQYAEHRLAVEQNEVEARSIEENSKHMRELDKLRNDAEREAAHYAKEVERLHEDAQHHNAMYAQELAKLKQDAQNQAALFAREIAVLREVNLCPCKAQAQLYETDELGPNAAATRRERVVDTGQSQCNPCMNYAAVTGQHSPTGRVGQIAQNAAFPEQPTGKGDSCSEEASELEDEDGYRQNGVGDLNISPLEASKRFANDTDHYRVRMVLEAENRFLRSNLKELQHQNATVGKIIFDLRRELETAGLLKPSNNWGSNLPGKGDQTLKEQSPASNDASPTHSPTKRPGAIRSFGSANKTASAREELYKDEPPLSLVDREELQMLRSYYTEMSAESDHDYAHGKPPTSAASSVMSKQKRGSFTPEMSFSQRLKLFSPGQQAFSRPRDTMELSSRQHHNTLSPETGHQRPTFSRESLQDRERLIERRFQDSKKKSERGTCDSQERGGSGKTNAPLLGPHSPTKIMNSGPLHKQGSSSESEDDSCYGGLGDDSDSSVDEASPDASRPHKVYRRTPTMDSHRRGYQKTRIRNVTASC